MPLNKNAVASKKNKNIDKTCPLGRSFKFFILLCMVIFYSVLFPVISQNYSSSTYKKNSTGVKNKNLIFTMNPSDIDFNSFNESPKNLPQENKNNNSPDHSGLSNDQLIDGYYTEIYNFSSYSNQIIELNNSDYGEITELSMNFTDIKDSRNYIDNGNFTDNVDNWVYNNTTDIKFNSINSTGVLNLTGLESPNPFYVYNGNEAYTDDLSDNGDWLYSASGGYYSIGRDTTRNLYGNTGCILSEFGDPFYVTGYASGYSYMNFTYNGTNKILDSELSFYYNMEVGDSWTSENSISTNLSVSIVQPNGTEIKLDNWVEIYSPAIKGSLGKTFHSFNNSVIGHAIHEPGNYTLKFYFGHNHYYSGSGIANFYSKIMVDGIYLNVNYSKKVYSPGDKITVNQNFECDRDNLQSAVINLDYQITEPFKALNESDSNFSIWLNDNLIYTEYINKITKNQKHSLSINFNPDIINKQNNNLSIGINLDPSESIIFLPNNIWLLIFDNVSLEICGQAKPASIDLAVYNSLTSTITKINSSFYGNGTYSIINSSMFYKIQSTSINNSVKFLLLTNTTDFSCNTSLVLKKISWRDSIFTKIAGIEEKLKEILSKSQSTILNSDFLQYYLPNINNIVDLASKGRIDEAIKNSSIISEHFPFLLKLLFDNLNSDFNTGFLINNSSDHPYNNIEIMSLGNFKSIQNLFSEISPFYRNLEFVNFDREGINQEVYTTYYTLNLRLNLQLQQIKDRISDLNLSLEELNEIRPTMLTSDLNSIINSLSKMEYGLNSYVILQDFQKYLINNTLSGLTSDILKDLVTPIIYLEPFSNMINIGDDIFSSIKSSSYPKSLEFEYITNNNTELQIPLVNNLPGIFSIPFSHYNISNITSTITDNLIYSKISNYFDKAGLYDNQTTFSRRKIIINTDEYLNLLTLQFLISDSIFRTNIEGFLGNIYYPLEDYIKNPFHLPSFRDIFNTTNDLNSNLLIDLIENILNSSSDNLINDIVNLTLLNNNSLGLDDFLNLNITFNYDSLMDFGNTFYTTINLSASELCKDLQSLNNFIIHSNFSAVQNVYLETDDEIFRLTEHFSDLNFKRLKVNFNSSNSYPNTIGINSSYYSQIPIIAPDFATNMFLYSLIHNPSEINPRYIITIDIYANSTLIQTKRSNIPYFIKDYMNSYQTLKNTKNWDYMEGNLYNNSYYEQYSELFPEYSGDLEFIYNKEIDFSDDVGDFSFTSENIDLIYTDTHENYSELINNYSYLTQHHFSVGYFYSLNFSENVFSNLKNFARNHDPDSKATIVIYLPRPQTFNPTYYINWNVNSGDSNSNLIYYNFSSKSYENSFYSVDMKYSTELSAFDFKFNPNDFLSEFDIDNFEDVDYSNFRSLFNISIISLELPINVEDIYIKFMLGNPISSNTPLWSNNSKVYMSINDIDLKFELVTSILSLSNSNNDEFRISKITLDYDEQILNPYYYVFYNSSAWILDDSQSIYLRLYLKNIGTFSNFTIRIYYLMEQRNGNEIQGYTDLECIIQNIYHFKKPISPNILIGVIIAILCISFASYIINMHSNFYFIRLILNENKKHKFKISRSNNSKL